jgi:hypothetical protein
MMTSKTMEDGYVQKNCMKLAKIAVTAAVLAIIAAGWSVCQAIKIQARLDSMKSAAPKAQPAAIEPGTNIETRVAHLEKITPSVAQTMLSIQSHFAKLHYAAEARNWDLARFEREEIEEDLETVAAMKPQDNGANLLGIISAFTNGVSGPMAEMKDAIAVSDRPLFRKSYQEMASMCNACHQATGRPFIFITVPATNPPPFSPRWEPPH